MFVVSDNGNVDSNCSRGLLDIPTPELHFIKCQKCTNLKPSAKQETEKLLKKKSCYKNSHNGWAQHSKISKELKLMTHSLRSWQLFGREQPGTLGLYTVCLLSHQHKCSGVKKKKKKKWVGRWGCGGKTENVSLS